jgi:hypothetical protein
LCGGRRRRGCPAGRCANGGEVDGKEASRNLIHGSSSPPPEVRRAKVGGESQKGEGATRLGWVLHSTPVLRAGEGHLGISPDEPGVHGAMECWGGFRRHGSCLGQLVLALESLDFHERRAPAAGDACGLLRNGPLRVGAGKDQHVLRTAQGLAGIKGSAKSLVRVPKADAGQYSSTVRTGWPMFDRLGLRHHG